MGIAADAAAATRLSLVEVITSPPRSEHLKRMVAAFEEANPDIDVEVTSLPWGQAFEKLATMVQAGQIPDVVEMPDRWLALYANSDRLVDLQPYMKDWAPAERLTRAARDFGSVIPGKIHEIPYGFYLRAMFWNKKLFKEAGLDRAPETLDEFMGYSAKISELPGKSGYCLRGGPGATNGYIMFMMTMRGDDTYFVNGESTLAGPKAVEGLKFIADLYKQGYAPRDSVNWGFNEIVAGFYSGTCAMLDQDPDALIAIKERMPEEDFAVAPMPLGPDGKSFPTIGYAGWAMFKASENKDAAWKLIAHLSSPEMNLEWSKFVGVIPIFEGAEQDPYFRKPQFDGWFKELNDERWEPTSMPTYLPAFGYFADVLSIQGGQELLLGQRSAEDVAQEWADYLTDGYEEWKSHQ
jgi:multiple sugar transport system substrate-binding protein